MPIPRKTSVLIVDDDEGSVLLAATLFIKRGYEVRTAFDGRRALELVNAEPPDCILLDVTMPGISGTEVLSVLKKDPATASIPVILVTAGSPDRDVRKDYRDADWCLMKPCSAAQLVHRVRRATGASTTPSAAAIA